MNTDEDVHKRSHETRRALFPSNFEDDDGDLGHMSPLDTDRSTSDSESGSCYFRSLKNHTSEDYDILEDITKENLEPLDENTVVADTPIKESLVLKLETPHDTLIQSSTLPKLVRKPLHPIESEENQLKASKVRTALFPESELTVSTKTFYSKNECKVFERKVLNFKVESARNDKKKSKLLLCARRTKKNRYGQINTGVRHKIKKPRYKKPTKQQLLNAALTLIDNSPLNGYLEDLKEMQNRPKIIQPIPAKDDKGNKRKLTSLENDESFVEEKQISDLITFLEEDKENLSVPPPLKRQKIEILSPISQMCDTTSGLALNSPKKARNLNSLLENMQPSSQEPKLFPVFNMASGKAKKEEKQQKSGGQNQVKRWKSLPPNQMLLDAGQKKFGLTQCSECEIVYHMGDPSEEIMHLNYHNAGNVLRFNGWKNEDVVVDFLNARVIRVKPNDSKVWWKKVSSLLEVVNKDLGYYDVTPNCEHCQVYLYIKNKMIVGCLVAEPRSLAHRKLECQGADLCSEETFPVKCGVSRIWVSRNHRKSGIATTLMDCMKKNFVFGAILRNEDVAFSSPTQMGDAFARKYFKGGNYLVYM